MTTSEPPPWHARPINDVISTCGTDADRGLTAEEAHARLTRDGENRLAMAEGPGLLARLLGQFTDITVIALLVAAAIAVGLAIFMAEPGANFIERFGDAIAILAIVLLNAGIGFVQEQRAESALKALNDMTSPSAVVIRAGEQAKIAAYALVSGDVVVLNEGDRIPADLRLIATASLRVNESTLTGESVAVDKDADATLPVDTPLAERTVMAFSGTHVTAGRGRGVVVATGMATELGRIAGMLAAVQVPDTPLKQDLRRFGNALVIGCVVISALVFAVGLLQQTATVPVLFLTAVSLAVAAIPEGLPAITTIVLAMGVQRMARRNALVRRLSAVETLGSAQIICTDKTGTLTQNRMVVRRLWCADRQLDIAGDYFEPDDPPRWREPDVAPDDALRELLDASHLAPDAQLIDKDGRVEVTGDTTDGALLLLGRAFAPDHAAEEVIAEFPFDHERMMATTIVERASGRWGYTHGAPERILELCETVCDRDGLRPLTDADREALHARIFDWGGEGYRVLAIARHALAADADTADNTEHDLALLGLVAISDPPRTEVAVALERSRNAGVRTMMITGDHPHTAAAIAREIRLSGELEPVVVSGAEVEAMGDEELARRAPGIDVVARATAAHKLRIVQALTGAGYVTAMTGDGVNDAPAIKAASIGIAMGQAGTDVTREAAALVLSDDNYATIIAAIEEGRIIFANIKKFILFLLCVNSGLVLAVFIAAMLGWPPMLTPTQILWINLITNGMPALALGMEPIHPDPMKAKPRDVSAGIIERHEVLWLLGYGVVMAVVGLAVFHGALGEPVHTDPIALRRAQTMAFTVLALAPLFHAHTTRDLDTSIFKLGVFSNWRVWGSMAVAFVLQALALYVPGLDEVFHTTALSLHDLLVVLGLSAAILPLAELEKLLRRWFGGPRAVRGATRT